MSRRSVTWALAAGLLASALSAAARDAAPAPSRARLGTHLFDRLDGDHDGFVTLAEARAAGSAAFVEFDADGDGSVTRAEAKAGAVRWRARRLEERFAVLDVDGDGALTSDELGAKRWRRADRNRDGAVTLAELRSITLRGGKRGRGSLGRFEAWDADGDGAVTRSEVDRELSRRFAVRDRDQDGTLERGELYGRSSPKRSATAR